jgi:branched-chain amino acid transport system ATP-binding protein
MLEIDQLTVNFGPVVALSDVTLRVNPGEVVVLLGSNGAGKSTLFRAVSGLLPTAGGRIRFQGHELGATRAHQVVRHGVAHAPEGKHLFGALTVRKNLLLGGYMHRRDREGTTRTMEEVFTLFPILRDKAEVNARSLSGGQQQMVAIGRAMMARPRLLLLDEPSLGLAPKVTEELMNAVEEIRRRGTMVLLAEQNAHAALSVADRGYVLEGGSVVLEGASDELLGNPAVRRAYLGM